MAKVSLSEAKVEASRTPANSCETPLLTKCEVREAKLAYKRCRAKLVDEGVFKKRKSIWNQYVKENFPIAKAELSRKLLESGKPQPTGREFFTMINKELASKYPNPFIPEPPKLVRQIGIHKSI